MHFPYGNSEVVTKFVIVIKEILHISLFQTIALQSYQIIYLLWLIDRLAKKCSPFFE